MLFKGNLSGCVDHLARIPADSWADRFIVIHVPAWHCYCVDAEGDIYRHIAVPDQLHSRVIFHGSIVEMAHFVLCPPLTQHLTRFSLPELTDNAPHPDHPDKPDTPPTPAAEPNLLTRDMIEPPAKLGDNGNRS